MSRYLRSSIKTVVDSDAQIRSVSPGIQQGNQRRNDMLLTGACVVWTRGDRREYSVHISAW